MQCVILAAGKGTRMRPLTDIVPKPLITVSGKPILDHLIEALPSVVTEIILVTNYLEEQIRSRYGDHWHGRSVTYVTQDNSSGGTGAALLCAKDVVTGKFLLLNGDDIYGAQGLERLVGINQGLFAYRVDQPKRFGVLVQNEDGTLLEIIEKPEHPPSNLVNIGGYVLQPQIFEYETAVDQRLGEILVTDMVTKFAVDFPMQVIEQELWIPIGYPEDIKKAEAILGAKDIDSGEGL